MKYTPTAQAPSASTRGQTSSLSLFCATLASPFGDILILWEHGDIPKLRRIYLPKDGMAQSEQAHTDFPTVKPWPWNQDSSLPPSVGATIEWLKAIPAGRPTDMPSDLTNLLHDSLSCLGSFQRTTLLLEATIPFGHISTYRELARAAGNPRAFRAVAHALSHNPLPLLIPCHRVIASNGSLAGYQGGIAMKKYLLELEGITFSSGHVELKRAPLWKFNA